MIVTNFHIRYGAEVAEALRAGHPVVALESTIVSHGLPRPDNLHVARQIEQAVRSWRSNRRSFRMACRDRATSMQPDAWRRSSVPAAPSRRRSAWSPASWSSASTTPS
jgi:hypothetical protein